jgi:TolB-like protein/Flp pilus assembly protein TadD
MDVLMALARRAGEVVSVDELISDVWQGVSVGDGSAYVAIKQLRAALDDPREPQSHIETIPKRGYRLSVPVECEVIPVVVLPFANLSSDSEQEYFADGVADEIRNALSRTRDLRVTGRTSSCYFKGRSEDVRAIGRTLGVDYVLEGSVRKAGDQIRVTAQLVNVETRYQLWSETYQRQLAEIFVIQDEIATSVASALQIVLGVGALGRMPGMTRSVAAYDAYLRARSSWVRFRTDRFQATVAHLQRAIALDPSFAMAWGALRAVYVDRAVDVPGEAEEWRRKAAAALDRARELSPDSPAVLVQTTIELIERGSWLQAGAVHARAVALFAQHSMDGEAAAARGYLLVSIGRAREAIHAFERARAIDPLVPGIALGLTIAYVNAGEFAAALAEVDRGRQLDGYQPHINTLGLSTALSMGDRVEIENRLALLSEGHAVTGLNRVLAQVLDNRAEARRHIRRLAAATVGTFEKTMLAIWAGYYGEPELALELLYEILPEANATSALWGPLMRDVRRLPGFKDLVRDTGLVDYWRAYGWPDFCRPISDDDFVCQ